MPCIFEKSNTNDNVIFARYRSNLLRSDLYFSVLKYYFKYELIYAAKFTNQA